MAVITFDQDKGIITVLVEKNDLIREVEDNTTFSKPASSYGAGTTFINGENHICMVRGER